MSMVFKPEDPKLSYLGVTIDVGIERSCSYESRVFGIIDGDTLEVDFAPTGPIRFGKAPYTATVQSARLIQRVRLLGIDAPETKSGDHASRQCELLGVDISVLLTLAKISTIHLQSLCPKGTKVTLKTTGKVRDDYDRALVGVYVGELCVNRAMVEHGYSLSYRGYSDWEDYGQMEALARDAGRGIWGQCEESYYPASNSTKTYHRPGCGSAPKSGAGFNSPKEAETKGFKPCRACIPDFKRV